MRLADYLNQRPKNQERWEQNVARQELFFQVLINSNVNDFNEAAHHLIKWYEAFRLLLIKQQIKLEKYDDLIAQWKHAAKLFLCAEFVAKNISKLPAAFEREEDKDWILTGIQECFEEITQKTLPIEVHGDEVLLLCLLFSDKTVSKSAIEIPFATAPATASEKGKIHILELRRVRGCGFVQQNPCAFPSAEVYAKKIDSDFRMAIKTAFLLNRKPWEEEKMDEKFGPLSQYGIIWDVKPYYIEAEKEKLSDFEKRKIKDSMVEPDEEIKELLDRQPDQTLYGESIGLAALAGIYRVLRNQSPDERVLFSAKLEEALENGEEVVKISGVAGIPQKIKAAIETNFIDTFVLHEDNFKQRQTGEKSDERKEIEALLKNRNHFRLKLIDCDGNERDVFPPLATL
jgi:hypothetical protein